MLKIVLPFKTESINHLYGHRGYRKFLKPEARKLREKIAQMLEGVDASEYKDKRLKIVVKIYENWYTKNGTIAKKDVANREKFAIDSVFKALGLDDRQIFYHLMIKEQSTTEKMVIEIDKYL